MSSVERRSATVWRVRYRDNGHNRARTFGSEKGARAWQKLLDVVGPEAALRTLAAPEVKSTWTVAEQVEHHIAHLTGVTDGTRKTYRAYLRRDMARIGALPLDLLDRAAVANWINTLAREGLSGKSIRNRHGLLSAAMSTAVMDKRISENPCHKMRLPRTTHLDTEMIFLSGPEFETLHVLIKAHYQPLVLFLVGTGVRWGEATALQVRDVDLDGHQARIRQAWKMTGGGARELGPPKSARSLRTVAVPVPAIDAIRPLVAGRKPSAFVFTNAEGNPIKQATFWRLVWAPAVQEMAGDTVRVVTDSAGRKSREVVERGEGQHPRIHDLRHTFASWAISKGIPLPVLQRQLGHESITTTVDRYGHLARSDFDALAASTATFLTGLRAIE